jgi:hypothetical protein
MNADEVGGYVTFTVYMEELVSDDKINEFIDAIRDYFDDIDVEEKYINLRTEISCGGQFESCRGHIANVWNRIMRGQC